MYRGVIQHRTYVTDFLEERTRERGLDPQIGHGRIYRVVHIASGRGAAPRLSRATTAELVQTLTHANGWWRITAQRLLVERQARDAAPALRALMRHADDRVRLHALWTLDGVGEADSATVRAALADASPYVRAAAVRVAEPHIARGDTALRRAALARVHDPAPHVRRQLAATLLTLPVVEQRDAARTIFERGESDVVVADFAARALGTAALDALERVVAALRGDSARIAIEALAAAVGRARNGAAIHRALSHAGDAPVARALVAGLLRGIGVTATSVSVPARPRVLTTMGANRDSSAAVLAARLDAALHWPGKPRRAPGTGRDLTPAESARIEAGRAEFARICAACHQATGVGAPGVAAPLVGSPYVNGIPARVIRILLQGKEGALLMPPVGATMTDDQVAAVLSYVRRAWGHVADPIDAAAVRDVRGATGTRKRPWTDAELARLVH